MITVDRDSEADQLFQSSYEKYKEAADIRPSDHEIYFNWANALYHQATMPYVTREASISLMASAGEQYFHSLKLKPDYSHAMNNWTRVLIHMAAVNATNTEKIISSVDSYLNAVRNLALMGTLLD